MNLLKAQDILKGIPDKELANMIQSPRGDIPPFLVASEAGRRAKMRQEYQGDMQGKAPTSTVLEDLMNNLGVAALQPPGQQKVAVQAPQMPAAPQQPVQMYDGGIVSFANGGTPSMEDVESYLAPQAGGSEMGFSASVAPHIPGLDARIRAGVIGNNMQGNPQVSGYQIGYEDGVNAAMASITPTPAGNIVGGEYRRQLGNDSQIAVRGNFNPYGEMPAMEARQAPLSIEYMKHFASGGIASFADGGYTDLSAYMPKYASDISVPEIPGFESFLSQIKGEIGASELPEYRQQLAQERAKLEKESPADLSSFLTYIGRGLSKSRRPDFIGALSEGISGGIELQEQAQQRNREAQHLLRQSEIDLAGKERAERAGLIGLARQLEGSAIDRRNSAVTQSYNAQNLAQQARHFEGVEKHQAGQRKLDERRLGIEGARESRQGKVDDARLAQILKQTDLLGTPKPVGIDKLMAARATLQKSMTGQNKLKSLMSMYGVKQFGKDPAKDALIEAAYNQWIESQVPTTQGVYTGSVE